MIKVKKRRVLLLPGDGIGPEVIAEVKKVINWFNDKKSLDFEIDEDLVGGISFDKHGTPLTDEVFYSIRERCNNVRCSWWTKMGWCRIFKKT